MKSKYVAKINAIITFPTSVKIHFVCFTVTGSFSDYHSLVWQFERFVISQSKVWPRQWVGTLTNCSKLRLPSITVRAAVQGSEGLSKWTLRSPTTNGDCPVGHRPVHHRPTSSQVHFVTGQDSSNWACDEVKSFP